MARSIAITDIATEPDGRILVTFNARRIREFGSLAEIRDSVRDVLTEEVAEALLMARAMSLANPRNIIGKTLTVDIDAAANIIRVT